MKQHAHMQMLLSTEVKYFGELCVALLCDFYFIFLNEQKAKDVYLQWQFSFSHLRIFFFLHYNVYY